MAAVYTRQDAFAAEAGSGVIASRRRRVGFARFREEARNERVQLPVENGRRCETERNAGPRRPGRRRWLPGEIRVPRGAELTAGEVQDAGHSGSAPTPAGSSKFAGDRVSAARPQVRCARGVRQTAPRQSPAVGTSRPKARTSRPRGRVPSCRRHQAPARPRRTAGSTQIPVGRSRQGVLEAGFIDETIEVSHVALPEFGTGNREHLRDILPEPSCPRAILVNGRPFTRMVRGERRFREDVWQMFADRRTRIRVAPMGLLDHLDQRSRSRRRPVGPVRRGYCVLPAAGRRCACAGRRRQDGAVAREADCPCFRAARGQPPGLRRLAVLRALVAERHRGMRRDTVAVDLLEPASVDALPQCPTCCSSPAASSDRRRQRSDLGDQHRRPGICRPPFRPLPHRRVFNRQRVPVCSRCFPRLCRRPMCRYRAATTPNRASVVNGCSSTTARQQETPTLIFRLNYARGSPVRRPRRHCTCRQNGRAHRPHGQPFQCDLAGRRQFVCAALAGRMPRSRARAQRYGGETRIGDGRCDVLWRAFWNHPDVLRPAGRRGAA